MSTKFWKLILFIGFFALNACQPRIAVKPKEAAKGQSGSPTDPKPDAKGETGANAPEVKADSVSTTALKKLEAKLAEVGTSVVELKDQVGDLVDGQDDSIDQLKEVKQTVATNHQNVIATIADQGASLSTQIAEMGETTSSLAQKVDQLDGRLGNISEQIVSMDSRLGELLSCTSSMNTKLGDLFQQTESLNDSFAQALTRLDALDGKLGNLGQQVHETNAVLLKLGEAMRDNSTKVASLGAEVTQIDETNRPKIAAAARNTSFSAMVTNQGLVAKVAAAEKYFSSFEYQLYAQKANPDQNRLNELKAKAVSEFFGELRTLLKDGRPVEEGMSLTGAPEEIEALTVALDKISGPLGSAPSLLTMIKESLLLGKDQAQEVAKSGPAFASSILAEKKLAVWLLKVRLNSLVKLSLARLSPLVKAESSSWWGFAKPYLESAKGSLQTLSFLNWDLQATKVEISTLEEAQRLSHSAVETQKILAQLAENDSLPFFLSNGLNNMNLVPEEKEGNDPRVALVLAIAADRTELLKNQEPTKKDDLQEQNPVSLDVQHKATEHLLAPGSIIEAPPRTIFKE